MGVIVKGVVILIFIAFLAGLADGYIYKAYPVKIRAIENISEDMKEDFFEVQSEVRLLAVGIYETCGLWKELDDIALVRLDDATYNPLTKFTSKYIWLRNDYGLSHQDALGRVKKLFVLNVKKNYNYKCPRELSKYPTKILPLPSKVKGRE